MYGWPLYHGLLWDRALYDQRVGCFLPQSQFVSSQGTLNLVRQLIRVMEEFYRIPWYCLQWYRADASANYILVLTFWSTNTQPRSEQVIYPTRECTEPLETFQYLFMYMYSSLRNWTIFHRVCIIKVWIGGWFDLTYYPVLPCGGHRRVDGLILASPLDNVVSTLKSYVSVWWGI